MCIPHNVGGILILTALKHSLFLRKNFTVLLAVQKLERSLLFLSLDSTDGNDVIVQVWSKDVTVSI